MIDDCQVKSKTLSAILQCYTNSGVTKHIRSRWVQSLVLGPSVTQEHIIWLHLLKQVASQNFRHPTHFLQSCSSTCCHSPRLLSQTFRSTFRVRMLLSIFSATVSRNDNNRLLVDRRISFSWRFACVT